MDGEGGEGERELRGHKPSVANNSSTHVVGTAKQMITLFPGCHTLRSSTNSYMEFSINIQSGL